MSQVLRAPASELPGRPLGAVLKLQCVRYVGFVCTCGCEGRGVEEDLLSSSERARLVYAFVLLVDVVVKIWCLKIGLVPNHFPLASSLEPQSKENCDATYPIFISVSIPAPFTPKSC